MRGRSNSSSSSSSEYMTIRDAVAAGRRKSSKVNLVGFLVEFSLPRKSQGTDYVANIKIVDDLLSELSINMFCGKEEDFPRLKSYKDVIVLINVSVGRHYNEICGVFYKQSSSFALFDVKTTTHSPYQTSPGFDLQKLDMAWVSNMRALSSHYEVSAGSNEYLITLKELGTSLFFDLVCQVLHVEKASDGRCILFVWDGNDAPSKPVQRNLEDEEENPLPLEVEPTTLHMAILRRFPRVGTVLRVVAPVDMNVYFQEMGQWVKIRNMKYDELDSGLWRGSFLPTTKVRFLPENEDTVVKCKRVVAKRGSHTEGRLPFGSNPLLGLTVVDSAGFPFATLLDLITHTEAETIVRCVVRVVAICPSDVERLLRLHNGEYMIILTLEDPTARIHALLDGHHGNVFFEDFMHVSDASKRTKMNELLGCQGNHRNPPWVECCIKSNANRIYYICQTKLVA